MEGKLRNMTAIYLTQNGKMLMLYRIGSRVVAPSWCGIGGHFEKDELNDAKAAMLREMNEEIGLSEHDLENPCFKYVTLRAKNGEIRQNYYFFADLKENAVLKTDCNEGKLEWVKIQDIYNLPIWEGDKIFLKLIEEKCEFFSLKLEYQGQKLIKAILNGKNLEI